MVDVREWVLAPKNVGMGTDAQVRQSVTDGYGQ